jgi:hypothetical protein
MHMEAYQNTIKIMIGNQAEIRVKTGAVYENTGSLTSVATLCGFMVSCFGFLRVD